MPRRSLVAAPALALSLLVAAAGCSSDDAAPPDTTAAASTTAAPTTTDSTVPTTAAPATTTAPPAPTGAPTAADAAWGLYNAWVADDRAAAAQFAEPGAVESMWQAVHGPYELYRHCDDGEFDTGGCLFRDRTTNHTIQINLERRGEAWVVIGTFYSEE